MMNTLEKNKCAISVITPVYNAEKYVYDCIRCLQKQTFTDYEHIIVDDGSQDRSMEICLKEAQIDDRIKVFHFSRNRGPGTSRNDAIELACGKYIVYLDADDYLDDNALNVIFDACEQNELDVLAFDANVETNESSLRIKANWMRNEYLKRIGIPTNRVIDGEEMFKRMQSNKRFPVPVWLMAYKREYLMNNRIRFVEGIDHEDEFYTPIVLLNAKSVMYIRTALYNYRLRNNSVTTRDISITRCISLLIGNMFLIDRFKSMIESIKAKDEVADYMWQRVRMYRQYYNRLKPEERDFINRTSNYVKVSGALCTMTKRDVYSMIKGDM